MQQVIFLIFIIFSLIDSGVASSSSSGEPVCKCSDANSLTQQVSDIVCAGMKIAQKGDAKALGELIKNHIDAEYIIQRIIQNACRNAFFSEDQKNRLKDIFLKKIISIYSTEGKVKIFKSFQKATSKVMQKKDSGGTWIETTFESSTNSQQKASIQWRVSQKTVLEVSKIIIEGIDMESTILANLKTMWTRSKNNVDTFLTILTQNSLC